MYKNIPTQHLRNPLHKRKGISVDVLRLDLMHPFISGNKWFKLKYHITAALREGKTGLLSFGGAFSNHLVAMAQACSDQGLRSAAFVRGEDDPKNHSLSLMREAGMQVMFVSRNDYKNKNLLASRFLDDHPDIYLVPEGGQSAEGIKGAAEILSYAKHDYTHVICAVGTGTTLAGIINASSNDSLVIGICVLKTKDESMNEWLEYLSTNTNKKNYCLSFKYHFGGYAKKDAELVTFMNRFFESENIPSDFVYTGKVFFAVEDMIKNGDFQEGAKILVIHTGGLQGNRSLPAGTLVF